MAAPEPFVVPDVAAWGEWLVVHEDSSDGVWLTLATKGTTTPRTLTYAEALDVVLCSGWIDGQERSFDEAVFLQRFTPRRRRSMWSARNVEHVARLKAAGRMRARGRAEVALAQADGRWDRAYAGSARCSVHHPVVTATPGATRERVITRVVGRLVARDR